MAVSTSATTIVMMMLVVMAASASFAMFMVVAASASFTMLMVVVASAVTVIATTTAAVATIATATTRQVLHHVVNLLLGCIAILQNGTFEVKCLASQGVVEINLYLLFAYFQYATIETMTFLVLQRYDCVNIDVLVVEVTIDAEYLACKV